MALLFGVFLVASTQFYFADNLAWHDQQRIGQLVLLLCMPLLPLLTAPRRPFVAPETGFDWLTISIAAFAGIGAFSACLSAYPRWAFIEWSLLLSLVAGAATLFHVRRIGDSRDDAALLLVFVAATALLLGRMLLVYAFALAEGAEIKTVELSGLGFSNRRFLGQYLTLALPLMGAFAMQASSNRQRKAAAILMVGTWLLAFTSATRGTFLGVSIALLVVCIVAGRQAWPFLRQQIASACGGLAVYALLFIAIPGATGTPAAIESRVTNLSSSNGRFELWQHAMQVAAGHPWLGVGPMHLAHWRLPSHAAAHPHNAMIQVAAEWGIPALCIAATAVVILLRRTMRRLDRSRLAPIDMALLAALAGAASQSLVDGVVVMPVTQAATMIAIGWAAGRWASSDHAHGMVRSSGHARKCALLMVGLAATTITLSIPEFNRVASGLTPLNETSSDAFPRFWQQGWLPVQPRPRP